MYNLNVFFSSFGMFIGRKNISVFDIDVKKSEKLKISEVICL
jgi:hypothetical protein